MLVNNDEITKAISRSSDKFSKKKKSKSKKINAELEQQEGKVTSDVYEANIASRQLTQQSSNLDLQSQNLENKYLREGAKPKVCGSQASFSIVSCARELDVISLKEEGSSQERVCGNIEEEKVKPSAVPEGTMRLSDKPLCRSIRKKLVLRDLSSTSSSVTSASYADMVKVKMLGLKEESSSTGVGAGLSSTKLTTNPCGRMGGGGT
ncbi:hypothetical protein PVA18_04300 [Ehrlichia muris subsp. eauclairensis]|uniref:hypothetical protein n=1 Tax=Ehrlichia muris TaxID=35795 RepID=UPI003DA4CD08